VKPFKCWMIVHKDEKRDGLPVQTYGGVPVLLDDATKEDMPKIMEQAYDYLQLSRHVKLGAVRVEVTIREIPDESEGGAIGGEA
jgi:hypothetical protein